MVRKRIGNLKPDGRDYWYDLTPEVELQPLYELVRHDVLAYALPFLQKVESGADVIQLLISNPQLAAAPNRIWALSAAGYQVEARQQLQTELANEPNQQRRQFLLNFTAGLGLES